MKKIPITGRLRAGDMVKVDDNIYPYLIGQKLRYRDESKRGRSSYVYWYDSTKRQYIRLHRFVMQEKDPEIQIDHINGDVLDNRKQNLRQSTRLQNNKNRTGFRGSVSQYKGVSKLGKRWRAQISSNGKYYNLGTFDSEREAAENYDFFALRCHAEFARLNFPDKDYSNFIPKKKPEGWVHPDEEKMAE